MTPDEKDILIRIDERVAKLLSDMNIVCEFRQRTESRLSCLETRTCELSDIESRIKKIEDRQYYLYLFVTLLTLLVLGRYVPLNMP